MVWHRQLYRKILCDPLLRCQDLTCPTSYLCSLKRQRLAESNNTAVTQALVYRNDAVKDGVGGISEQQHLAVWDRSHAGEDLSKQLAVGFINVSIKEFLFSYFQVPSTVF